MVIYVLGGSGFIGSRISKYFLEEDYLVKSFSSSECDLLDKKSCEEKLKDISEEDVILMASSITRLKENSLESMIKNIRMADNVSKIIEKMPISQLIFLSTVDVYGINPKLPLSEKNQIQPGDYYSMSKIASEFLLKKSCSEKNTPLLILRLSGIYGENYGGAIDKLIKSSKEGKVTLFNEGKDRRDFVYIRDLYQIIKTGIDSRMDSTINIATGKDYSIKEICEMIKSYLGKEITFEYKKNAETENRIQEIKVDTSFFNEKFSNFKFTDIQEGLRLCIEENKFF